jgi:hypothetical protein
MRHSYQPCTEHSRIYCATSACKREEYGSRSGADNSSSVTVNTEGHMSIGLGGGLSIDPVDGSIGIQVGGITFDTA